MMQCVLERRKSDFLKGLGKGNEFLDQRFQEENPATTKDYEVSSFAWRNFDYNHGCAVLPLVRKHLNQVNINSLYVGCSLKMNQFTAERKVVQQEPISNVTYSINSSRTRDLVGSNAHGQFHKTELDNKAIKSNGLSRKFSGRNLCTPGSAMSSSNSSAISYMPIFGAKVHKYRKKISQKKENFKGNKCKKLSSDFVSAKTKNLAKISALGSSISEACVNNDSDHGDGSFLCLDAQEIFPPSRANKNDFEENCERIIQSPETTCSITSEIVEGDASVQPCAEDLNECYSMHGSEHQPLVKMLECINLDRAVDLSERLSAGCCNNFSSNGFLDKYDSLDSLFVGLNSDCAGINLKLIEKDTLGTDLLEEQSSPSIEDSSYHSVRDKVDVNGDVEAVEHGIQGCIDIESHLALTGKKTKQNKTATKSSQTMKSRGVGGLQGHRGNENNHAVWEKVQRNSSSEHHAQLDKVSLVCKQFKGACAPAGVHLPEIKDTQSGCRKQLKDKISRRLKRKNTREEDNKCCPSKSFSGKHTSYRMICKQPSKMLNISSMRYDRERLSSVSGSHSEDTSHGLTTSEPFQTAQVCVDRLRPTKIVSSSLNNHDVDNDSSSSPRLCNFLNKSTLSEVQSPIYLPHLFFHNVDLVRKESSLAELGKHNNHSRAALQNSIQVGSKDFRLTTFPSPDYLECADKLLAKCGTSKKSIQGRVISNSQDPVSFVFIGSQSSQDVNHCSLEGGHEVQKKNKCKDTATLQNCGFERDMAGDFICKSECEDAFKMDAERMVQVMNDACEAQLASEAVQVATGCPVADFERFLELSAPVISHKPRLQSCQMCSRNLPDDVVLCIHETPNIPLGCLWQWYEKHGSYGLEIKAKGPRNSERSASDVSAFRAYFVPYLSAIQLFKSHKNHSGTLADPVVSDSCLSSRKIKEPSIPIFSMPFPKPHTGDASIQRVSSHICGPGQPLFSENREISKQSVHMKSSGESELVFEYFEVEQPQRRRPLYDKIQQLVRGDELPHVKMYGDPTILNSQTLNDLHAGSWYSVAWYPIYRIPDGNFRAAFLTYHSLGHFVYRTFQADSPDAGPCVVSPVMGLQSYNAENECWFQPRNAASGLPSGLKALGILEERLRTLEEAASLMARAVVKKENFDSENVHPDYEFFLSRRH